MTIRRPDRVQAALIAVTGAITLSLWFLHGSTYFYVFQANNLLLMAFALYTGWREHRRRTNPGPSTTTT